MVERWVKAKKRGQKHGEYWVSELQPVAATTGLNIVKKHVIQPVRMERWARHDGSNCGMVWDELKDVNQLAVSVSIILDAPHTETHGHEAQVKYCIEYVHSF